MTITYNNESDDNNNEKVTMMTTTTAAIAAKDNGYQASKLQDSNEKLQSGCRKAPLQVPFDIHKDTEAPKQIY